MFNRFGAGDCYTKNIRFSKTLTKWLWDKILPLYYIFYLSSGNCRAAYLEIAAHTSYDVFSEYKYLIVNLVFRTFFVIAPFPNHCLLVSFYTTN